MSSIFEHPLLYELALGRLDTEISQECTVMRRIWSSYAGKHVRRILEIGCGTGTHALYLAGCGYQVTAIDLSRQMLEEAKQRARKSKVPVRFYLRDARKFSIPEMRCDVAIFMYQTFPLLLTNRAIYSHFRSVANHLREGGLYIIDLDREIGGFRMAGPELGTWSDETFQRGDFTVRRRWEIRKGSWREGYNTWVLICSFRGQGIVVDTEDVLKIRHLVPPTFEALVDASNCFKVVGYFSKSGDPGIPEDESNYFALLRCT